MSELSADYYVKTARCSNGPIPECRGCGRPLYASESRRVGVCVSCERSNPNVRLRRHRGPNRVST